MSLKAKIEAVIYASEEPVTLAQLTGLLGEEGQAELDALDSQQQMLALEEAEDDDAEALNAEVTEPDVVAEPVDAELADAGEAAVDESAENLEALELMTADVAAATGDEAAAQDEPSAEAVEAAATEKAGDEKKVARERERKLREYFRSLLDSLMAEYANNDRGLEIREVANGYRLATKPEYHDAVRGFVKSLKPPLKLSLQALETLAVIAYKQPVTAPEIWEIRGVDSGGVLGSLMTRKLIQTGGRKQVIGRPILYKTTKEFLLRFGLKDISELPSIEEFEKMAGELVDSEPVQEEIQMGEGHSGSEEAVAEGTPTSLDELNSAGEPTNSVHESVEDMVSDQSTSPEGRKQEPSEDVERSAGTHEPQADGDSEDPDVEDASEDGDSEDSEKRAEDEPEQSVADDVLIDGRLSGPPPAYDDVTDDPSAIEGEIQSDSKTGGA